MHIEDNIIYEDNHILVVEKPINIPVQKDRSGDEDLLNLLKKYIKVKYKKPGNVYLGLVHRLDRPVGGVMVFAKTSKAASRLSKQVRLNTIEKTYLAVVHGVFPQNEGTLIDYLIKDRKKNIVRVVAEEREDAKKAVLDYKVLKCKNGFSLMAIRLKTGRPHQIRVQLSNIGYPIYGDQKYGRSLNKTNQQIALWSYLLAFNHPVKKERMQFKTAPPAKYPFTIFENRAQGDSWGTYRSI